MKFSVVIPTYNRRALLERTLPTVLSQSFPTDKYEVIVIVDGSTVGTCDMLRSLKPHCTLRIIEQPNKGQPAAQNAGIRAARGQIVLFLDDDIVCTPALLQEHDCAHRDGDQCVVIGMVFMDDNSPATLATDWVRACTDRYVDRVTRMKEPMWPDDASVFANVSASRSALLSCGGFDDSLVGSCQSSLTDNDLGLRLWEMGLRFRYQPTAVAYQIYVKSSSQLVLNDEWWHGRAEVLLSRKHPAVRPYSGLAGLEAGSLIKRRYRQVVARFPVSIEPVLRVPFWIAQQFRIIPLAGRIGIRLLELRQGIVMLRSALRTAGSWKALRREFGMRLPVLLYHHVGPLRPDTYPSLTVSPEQFERQVNWLVRHGYVGILPSDWQAWRCEGKPLPDKPVLITFDDAYADLATYAFPVLRRHKFGAAVFAVAGQIGGTNTWDEQRGTGTHRLLTKQQLAEWAKQGIEVGAHSMTHADLTKLSDHELENEVGGSGVELSKLLGVRVASFAYPYGTYNETTVACVRRSFDLAFTAEEGMNCLQTNPCYVRRTMVQPSDSLIDLACRVRIGWSPIQHLRARVHLRSRLKRVVGIPCGGNN